MGAGDALPQLTPDGLAQLQRGGGGGVTILSVASYYRNREKLWPCGSPVARVDFLPFLKCVVPENIHTPPTEDCFWFEPPTPPGIPV